MPLTRRVRRVRLAPTAPTLRVRMARVPLARRVPCVRLAPMPTARRAAMRLAAPAMPQARTVRVPQTRRGPRGRLGPATLVRMTRMASTSLTRRTPTEMVPPTRAVRSTRMALTRRVRLVPERRMRGALGAPPRRMPVPSGSTPTPLSSVGGSWHRRRVRRLLVRRQSRRIPRPGTGVGVRALRTRGPVSPPRMRGTLSRRVVTGRLRTRGPRGPLLWTPRLLCCGRWFRIFWGSGGGRPRGAGRGLRGPRGLRERGEAPGHP